jgi:hypothetical protein
MKVKREDVVQNLTLYSILLLHINRITRVAPKSYACTTYIRARDPIDRVTYSRTVACKMAS